MSGGRVGNPMLTIILVVAILASFLFFGVAFTANNIWITVLFGVCAFVGVIVVSMMLARHGGRFIRGQ